MPDNAPTRVDVYVDPACPWSWVTSRWLVEVAGGRALELRWLSFSLLLRDGDQAPPGMPPEIAAVALGTSQQSLRLLRAFEALRYLSESTADADIDALYTAWGKRVYAPGPPAAPPVSLVPDLLGHTDPSVQAAADDADWDERVAESMRTAETALGRRPVIPTFVWPERQAAFAGPVLSPAPTGDAALRLWDAIATLAAEPGFHSFTRPWHPIPALPDVSAAG